ncbi:pilus assembly protein [Nocardioides carbamazepini]|nr:pilus assembly protein [Nocardioides carbamazepini]
MSRSSMMRPPMERGSASIEAAVGVPAFVLFIGLIILGGRTATSHQALQSAAADAARSASIARDATAAKADALTAAKSSLANQDVPCTAVFATVDTAAFLKPPGEPGVVSVTVSCRLDLSDLAIPGIPGSRILRSTMSSPLDTWRERT